MPLTPSTILSLSSKDPVMYGPCLLPFQDWRAHKAERLRTADLRRPLWLLKVGFRGLREHVTLSREKKSERERGVEIALSQWAKQVSV